MNRCLVVALAPLSWLSAQNAPPQFVPKAATMARVRVEGIPELHTAWPQTKLGKLFADPDVAAMVAKYGAWMDAHYARRTATLEAASRLDLQMESYEASNMFSMASPLGELNVPFAQMRRMEFFATMTMVGGFRRQGTTTSISPLPKYEGRWTHEYEREAAILRTSSWCVEEKTAKVGSYDAYRFKPPAEALKELGERSHGLGKWMLHLPGTFVTGTGLPDDLGTVDMSPAKGTPGLSMLMSVQDYMTAINMGGEVPAAIGLDALKNVNWRNYFDGDSVVEDFELELAEAIKPSGLVGAILEGGDKLLPQALPKGALAQLRFSVGYKNLVAAIEELAGDELSIPPALLPDFRKMLDGSVALGVCAPKGGMIPQVFLTLGLADTEAFDRVMAGVIAEGLPVKNVTYGGVECTLLKFPGMPAGIQPGYCRVGDKLHIAESGLSLRAFLKAQKNGADAMDVGDAPLASVSGDVSPSFDARFDLPLIYRNFYKKWLPLFEMTAEDGRPLTRQDMPDPDVIDEHVSAVRGVAFREGTRLILRHKGAIGPVLAGYLMAWPPMGGGEVPDRTAHSLGNIIGRHKVRAVAESFRAFEQREGRMPNDLAELFVAEKLAGDALLMPMDDLAETVVLPDGNKVKTSFRYFREPVEVGLGGNENRALLIEIVPSGFGRWILRADQETHGLYGEESRRAIDEFGK
ncbi:MAG: hypothetical protein ACI89X_000101 [Planctomycetota bacterium]|jgi:hypothetical protein